MAKIIFHFKCVSNNGLLCGNFEIPKSKSNRVKGQNIMEGLSDWVVTFLLSAGLQFMR